MKIHKTKKSNNEKKKPQTPPNKQNQTKPNNPTITPTSATKGQLRQKLCVSNPSRNIGSQKKLSCCPIESIPKED